MFPSSAPNKMRDVTRSVRNMPEPVPPPNVGGASCPQCGCALTISAAEPAPEPTPEPTPAPPSDGPSF